MSKATIETKTGMKVQVEGTSEEVTKIVSELERHEQFNRWREERIDKIRKRRDEERSGQSQGKLTDFINKLKDENFFENPKSLRDIQLALRTKGAIYPITTLSPILLRMVRKAEFERVLDGEVWKYKVTK